MSSSFISFKGKGYWVPDGFNELIARYLIQSVDNLPTRPEWLLSMRKRFFEIAQGYYTGWNNFGFDEFLDTEDRIEFFKQLLDELIILLDNKSQTISKEELNSYNVPKQFRSDWTKGVKTSDLTDIAKKLKEILGKY